MYAITADQVGSRRAADLADAQLVAIDALVGDRLVLPADRTAGDEIQAATDDAAAALAIVLHLTRDGNWSVGLGIGDVRTPLPEATRAMTGCAFILGARCRDGRQEAPHPVLARDRRRTAARQAHAATADRPAAAPARTAHSRGMGGRRPVSSAARPRRSSPPTSASPRRRSACASRTPSSHTETAAIAALVALLDAAGEPPTGGRP